MLYWVMQEEKKILKKGLQDILFVNTDRLA